MTERTCSIPGCKRPVFASGWCSPHYKRWWKYGDPLAGGRYRSDPVTTCSADGCGRPEVGRRLCKLHLDRLRRLGTTELPAKPTLEQRFWAKVDKGDGAGCWLWTHATSHGYGSIGSGGRHGPTLKAHRLSYELAYGPIPEGLEVRHRCDNPPCVRPDHLLLGGHAANMRDMADRGRGHSANRDKDRCKNGHPFDAANTRWRPTGGRSCRACARELMRARRAAKAEQPKPHGPLGGELPSAPGGPSR